MLVRLFESADAKGVDQLLNFNRDGDVRLEKDTVIVCGDRGAPMGVLVFRPGAFIHELHCGQSLRRARALAEFAIAREPGRTGIFCVKRDNEKMIRFVESLGAVRQGEDEFLYTLAL